MKRILSFLILIICFANLLGQLSLEKTFIETGHEITSLIYSNDGKFLATAGTDKNIFVWNTENGALINSLEGLNEIPLAVNFSPDGKYIVAGGYDNNITIWAFHTGEVSRTLTGHTDEITSIAINNENTLLASASKDGSVKVWNIERGESILNLTGHNEGVTSVDFHPNGEMIVSGCKKGEIIVWNVKNGHLVNSFTADEESIRSLKFSPNGNMFLSCGDSNIIRIWNSYNQVLQSSVLVHNKSVTSASFSPDGKYIISGGEDNFVIITNVISGEIIYHSEALSGSITSTAFNPNGMEFLASSYNSDILRRWDVSYLNIKPLVFADEVKKIDESLIPKIEWITEQNTESFSPATNIKFRVFSELHVDKLNVYNNDEINSIKANPEMQTGIWNEFEEKVYLKEDINEIIVELLFSTGRAVSEPLNINYKFDLDKLLATTARFRKISVMLRESDIYEYTVRGAEGYSFQSEVIDIGELENNVIDVQLVPLREETSIRLNNIHFATNSADLISESFAELDRVVDLITTNPLLVLEISAHTCDLGTDAYNMLLSERRAESVVDYLIDNDVLADRLVPKGYGMHNPYVPNTSEENRALNRRVEFKVIEIRDKDVELEIEKDEKNKEE